MRKSFRSLFALFAAGLVAAPCAHAANLLANPDFEALPNSINDAVLEASGFYYVSYSSPVTVDGSDSNFTGFIGTWASGGAGNGISMPIGTGNDSSRATGNRKAGRYIQLLPFGTISMGDQIEVDWRYAVADTYTSNASFEIQVFGLNQATGGELPTTFTAGLVFDGEAFNSAILETTSVSLIYDALSPETDDIDGIWRDAPTTVIDITQEWDYVGVAIRRSAGITNSTLAQTDDVSLQIIPEPATGGLLLLSLGSAILLRHRSKRVGGKTA